MFHDQKGIFVIILPIFKSLVVPVIWLAVIDVIYPWIALFFYLNRIFFPGYTKNETTNQISRLV